MTQTVWIRKVGVMWAIVSGLDKVWSLWYQDPEVYLGTAR